MGLSGLSRSTSVSKVQDLDVFSTLPGLHLDTLVRSENRCTSHALDRRLPTKYQDPGSSL